MDELVELIVNTHKQEKNIVLLKDDPQRDYLFSDPLRKQKQINLWWRGKYPGNFELCLAFAYLLQQSKLWPKSKICIKMVAVDPEQKQGLEQQFHKYKPKLRIKGLTFQALIDENKTFFSTFQTNSKDASLTFLGLRQPSLETTIEEYKEYFMQLMKNTEEVANIAYVLCGENLKFRNIFV